MANQRDEFRFPVREEDARALARNRLEQMEGLLKMARERVETESLFQVEADFQVMGGLCDTAAHQLLRVLEATRGFSEAGLKVLDHEIEVGEGSGTSG